MTTILYSVQTRDNKTFKFNDSEIDVKLSGMWKEMTEENEMETETEIETKTVDLANCAVDSVDLKIVIEFCKNFKKESFELKKPFEKFENCCENLPKWVIDFVEKFSKDELKRLIIATDYLNIPILLEILCCKYMFL